MTSVTWSSPPCPHFGVCGGCSLQHLLPDDYKAYKQQKILQAFDSHKISLEKGILHPIEMVLPQTRRRAVLKAHRDKTAIHIGFYQKESHTVVDLRCCLVVVPEIADLFSPLREVLVSFLSIGERAEIFVTQCTQGLDVALKRTQPSPLTLEQREVGASFATRQKLARLSIEDDPVYCATSPTLSFAGFPVDVTPEAFLQASTASDIWLADKVCEALPSETEKVADLFCGRGTLTLPLARKAQVQGYEMDSKSLMALEKTVKRYRLPVTLHHRHLFKEPLMVQELAPFDAVIVNPPREGAMAQAKCLARSDVKRLIMVSCNVQSGARDIKILREGNYRLTELHSLDQFLWSEHLEILAVLELKM